MAVKRSGLYFMFLEPLPPPFEISGSATDFTYVKSARTLHCTFIHYKKFDIKPHFYIDLLQEVILDLHILFKI